MAKISIIGQITEIEREIAMRQQVYPRQIAAGKMKQGEADMLMDRIHAVLKTLKFVQQNEPGFRAYYASINGSEPQ